MDKLLLKLLDFVSDPTVVLIVVLFTITIAVIWKLFSKQHEFIRERLDLLQKENEELRQQIQIFKEENAKFREASARALEITKELSEQPLLSEDHLNELRAISRFLEECRGFRTWAKISW